MELQLDVVLCPVLGPAFNKGYPGKLFSESGTFPGGQRTTVVETGQKHPLLWSFTTQPSNLWALGKEKLTTIKLPEQMEIDPWMK